jgi:hypothetical protein
LHLNYPPQPLIIITKVYPLKYTSKLTTSNIMLKNSHKYVYIVITIVKLALCKEERPIGLSRGRSVMQKRCAWGEKAEGILLLIYVQNKGRLEQILIVRSGLEKGERSKVCQQTHIGIAQYVLISIYPIKCVWSTPCLGETVHDLFF